MTASYIPASKAGVLLYPVTFPVRFSALDDFFILGLVAIEQCRVVAVDTIKELRTDKKLFKGEFKQICNKLYNPNGKTIVPDSTIPFVGWTRRIEEMIYRNLDDDEKIKFACLNDEIDNLIKTDMLKFHNAVSIEIGRYNLNNEYMFGRVVRAVIFTELCKQIINRATTSTNGDVASLCIDPSSEDAKRRAFNISTNEIDKIRDCLTSIMGKILPGVSIDIPEGSLVFPIMSVIGHKIMDPKNLYDCAERAGIDLRATSIPENYPESHDARRKAQRIEIKDTPRKKKKEEETEEKIEDLAEMKGWKLKKIS